MGMKFEYTLEMPGKITKAEVVKIREDNKVFKYA